jgi:peptide/nickel transport system substrate-binding protein
VSLSFWGFLLYIGKTVALPNYGGEYIEGAIGQPLHINPILAQSNDVDRDISQILFNGLLKYDPSGNIIPDLAESYEISDDKTTYTVRLRKGVIWHDGKPFSSSDVIFTINLLTDPGYRSPLRGSWQGVESNQIDDNTLEFKIPSPYAGFINNLTFGILPKHIWESTSPEKFHLSDINLEPIGTGPFKYNQFQKDSNGNILSYKMVANPNYFEGKPYISKITFNFYEDENSLVDAYNRKEVMGISGLSSKKTKSIKLSQSTQLHTFQIPRYFSVFLNQIKSVPLANDEVRQALKMTTNREEIINEVLDGKGIPVYSSFLPGMIGYSDEIKNNFDLEGAKKLLEEKGWRVGDDGIREKDGIKLEIDLVTTDWEELSSTAEIIKNQWRKAGIKINISTYSISDIQQNYIKTREYDALLFGQVLSADPDPFSFWHSSEKKDPGLNLSLFGKDDTDKLIEEGREEFDNAKRSEIYLELQKKIQTETPAIFLYSPSYVYPVSKKVQGIDAQNMSSPSKRFCDINKWYIKTKRIWR